MRLAVSPIAYTGLHSPEACAKTVLSCTIPAVSSIKVICTVAKAARHRAKSVQPAQRDLRFQRQRSFAIDVSFRSKPSTAPSLLRLAAIQYFERVKDSAGLAPKRRFIAAEPIKREVGKVGET